MARKFYRTVISIEIISESDVDWGSCSLESIARAIEDGDESGVLTLESNTVLTPQEAASALIEQGSEPAFFNLNEDGSDIE